jgi:hypothetical protein
MEDMKYKEVKDAIKDLDLTDSFRELNDIHLLEKIKNIFTDGDPRVWWLSLKNKPDLLSSKNEEEYLELTKYFSNDEECYFIAELDELHLFQSRIDNIVNLIGECSFFEYYVVDNRLTKLICETEHGDLLMVKSNNSNGN